MRFQFFQIIPETVRLKDNANFLYSCSSYPTQSLKKLHRRKGGGYFGLCIKIYHALGTLCAKRTFNRIAANDCSEPKVQDTVGCAKVGFDHSARSGGPRLGSSLIILVAALRAAYQFLFTTFKALLSSYGIKESSFRAIICEKCNPAFACSALKTSRSYSFC
jgi:hypothetical protein